MKINTSKTKYMVAGGMEHDRTRLGSSVTIGGNELEVVDEFVYLGSLVTSDNDTNREIRRRIINGSRAYYGLHKHLRSNILTAVISQSHVSAISNFDGFLAFPKDS